MADGAGPRYSISFEFADANSLVGVRFGRLVESAPRSDEASHPATTKQNSEDPEAPRNPT
jgi:hypothetical protein